MAENETAAPMIDIQHISKWYGSFQVLKDCTCQVAKGEVVVVCGPSGSGKSTLIKTVNGLEPVQQGRILVNGVDVTDPKTNLTRLRSHVGMVFQHFELFPHLSIRENLVLAQMKVLKRNREEATEKGMKLLDRVGLKSQAEKYPGQLSGGQQQRVGIARAFVSSPKVIFADEPTGNLDSRTSKQVLYRMLEMSKNSGVTFVMVTHEPELAGCADRIVTILDGKVCSNVVQDEETKKKNRDALFADLEGNLDIGGEAAKEQKK